MSQYVEIPTTMCLSPGYHESGRMGAVFMAVAYGNSGVALRYHEVPDSTVQERALVSHLVSLFGRNVARVASWDSHRQVMGRLVHRCLSTGTPFPWYYQDRFGPRYRYGDTQHLDIRDFLTEFGAMEGPVSLETAGVLIGLALPDTKPDEVRAHDLALRGLAMLALTVRCDILAGRIAPETGNRVFSILRTNLDASLSDAMMAGRQGDAFGVAFSPTYDGIRRAYSTFSDLMADAGDFMVPA